MEESISPQQQYKDEPPPLRRSKREAAPPKRLGDSFSFIIYTWDSPIFWIYPYPVQTVTRPLQNNYIPSWVTPARPANPNGARTLVVYAGETQLTAFSSIVFIMLTINCSHKIPKRRRNRSPLITQTSRTTYPTKRRRKVTVTRTRRCMICWCYPPRLLMAWSTSPMSVPIWSGWTNPMHGTTSGIGAIMMTTLPCSLRLWLTAVAVSSLFSTECTTVQC